MFRIEVFNLWGNYTGYCKLVGVEETLESAIQRAKLGYSNYAVRILDTRTRETVWYNH